MATAAGGGNGQPVGVVLDVEITGQKDLERLPGERDKAIHEADKVVEEANNPEAGEENSPS